MGSPSPSFDGSASSADRAADTPSQGPNGSNGADASAPSLAPSPSDGSVGRGTGADNGQGTGSDATEGGTNGSSGSSALKSTKTASAEDPDPPRLISASVNKTELGVGDTLTISYDIADPDGIKSVSLIIEHPKSGIIVRDVTGEHATEYTSTLIQSTTESGTYKVIGYKVTDGKGFVSSIISNKYKSEDPSDATWNDPFYGKTIFEDIRVISYTITISANPNPPQFISASVKKMVCHAGGSVGISCDIQDENGISAIAMVMLDPSGKKTVLRQGVMIPDEQMVSMVITPNDAPGLYKVIGYRVSDKKGYVASFIDKVYKNSMTWESTTYGTCTFSSLPSVSFLVADGSKADSYRITEGAAPVIEKGTDTSHTFRIDGDLDDFVVATLDGTDIPSSDYDLESGSTIITLKPSFLDSLQPGANEFATWYKDGGSATTTIEVLGTDGETVEGSTPEDPNADGSDAGPERNGALQGAGLLQSGDAAILLVVLGLLAIGTLLAVMGAVTIIRKESDASK